MKTGMARLSAGIAWVLLLVPNPVWSGNGEDLKQESSLHEDLEVLASWFAGEFDNRQQAQSELPVLDSIPELDRHRRTHVTHARLDVAQLGNHVFYIEEYIHDDPSQISRQRVVLFQVDEEANAIRMRLGMLRNEKNFLGAGQDVSKFADLKKEDIYFMEDLIPGTKCDVFWKRKAGQFEGAMLDKACKFPATKRVSRDTYNLHELYLSENQYWRFDAGFFVDDNTRMIGVPRDKPYKMSRADRFACKGYDSLPGNPPLTAGAANMKPVVFSIHTQGGWATVPVPSGNGMLRVSLDTRRHPLLNGQAEVLVLSSELPGVAQSLSWSIHDEDARSLAGLNPKTGVQIWCART